jgi:predicted peptidase
MVSSRVLLLIIALSLLTLPAHARKQETGFLNRTITSAKQEYRYQVYVPWNWVKNKKWPVILFLHGAGERGDDGLIQTQVGIGGAIRRFPDRFASLVVMPQCRRNSWWTHPEMEAMALKALDETIKEFNGDSERLYLTGLSMGGYGTWSIGSRLPARFAALAPICGGVRPPPRLPPQAASQFPDPGIDVYKVVAQKIGKTPVWIFHGDADTAVPVTESRKMNDALKEAGGNVKYSEYEGVGHNSWDKAYAEPDFIPWLMSHRRRSSD